MCARDFLWGLFFSWREFFGLFFFRSTGSLKEQISIFKKKHAEDVQEFNKKISEENVNFSEDKPKENIKKILTCLQDRISKNEVRFSLLDEKILRIFSSHFFPRIFADVNYPTTHYLLFPAYCSCCFTII
jgi:hypothetical protein